MNRMRRIDLELLGRAPEEKRCRRECRVETAAEEDDAAEDSVAVEAPQPCAQRGEEPEEEEDRSPEAEAADDPIVAMAGVAEVLDQLLRVARGIGPTEDEGHRADRERDVQDARQRRPALEPMSSIHRVSAHGFLLAEGERDPLSLGREAAVRIAEAPQDNP